MTLFLTSSPTLGCGGALNPANGFADALRAAVRPDASALFVTSEPGDPAFTATVSTALRTALEGAGLRFSTFAALGGGEGAEQAAKLVSTADFIILSGGHVPTENRFFHAVQLRAAMQGFAGTVLGISAGSMNSAETVYAQPELPGESIDPDYRRFLPGLGLTRKMLLPHYQETCGLTLDGRRLFEDITYPDSMGREFFAIPDGSYLFSVDGEEHFFGTTYRIADGKAEQIQ